MRARAIVACTKSRRDIGKLAPLTQLRHDRSKGKVKTIDESEDLKPEVLEQTKGEVKLLQEKVFASIEKVLQAASEKGEEERETAFVEADELIACIDADARRLYGDSANLIGAEWTIEFFYRA